MAKINNVGPNLTSKVANPFKTSRNSVNTTNPFKYSNFEGKTLDLQFATADVFESKSNSKMKMISASLAGCMNKIHSSITEPIVNFVKRVGTGISSAWDYAKNTNVSDIAGIKNFSEAFHNTMNTDIVDIGRGIAGSISKAGDSLKSKMPQMNLNLNVGKALGERFAILDTDVTEIGKGISERWNSLVSKIHTNENGVPKDATVADLRTMWEDEIRSTSEREVA